jgi:hypothetical protein
VGALVLLFFFKLSTRSFTGRVIKKSEFAAARVEPLGRHLCLRIKHHCKPVATISEVFDTLSRGELYSVFTLQASCSDARSAQCSLGHVNLHVSRASAVGIRQNGYCFTAAYRSAPIENSLCARIVIFRPLLLNTSLL